MGHRIESSTPAATGDTSGDVFWTDEACTYCGHSDCTQRFDHARLMAGREQTWREHNYDARRAAA